MSFLNGNTWFQEQKRLLAELTGPFLDVAANHAKQLVANNFPLPNIQPLNCKFVARKLVDQYDPMLLELRREAIMDSFGKARFVDQGGKEGRQIFQLSELHVGGAVSGDHSQLCSYNAEAAKAHLLWACVGEAYALLSPDHHVPAATDFITCRGIRIILGIPKRVEAIFPSIGPQDKRLLQDDERSLFQRYGKRAKTALVQVTAPTAQGSLQIADSGTDQLRALINQSNA